MIVVFDYNNSESEVLNKILKSKNIDFEYSLLENKISRAEKIILPHAENFNLAYRKMQLMNLFSFLRLLNKPILGINNGFWLMCNEIVGPKKCGLGFFQIDRELNLDSKTIEHKYANGIVVRKNGASLVGENLNNMEISFDQINQTPECEFSSSLIKFDQEIFTLTCEYKNYFSMELNLEENPTIANSIISNFVKL